MGVKGLMNYFQEFFYLYNGHLSCPQKTGELLLSYTQCGLRRCVAAKLLALSIVNGLILFCETKRNQGRYNETKGIMQIYFVLG